MPYILMSSPGLRSGKAVDFANNFVVTANNGTAFRLLKAIKRGGNGVVFAATVESGPRAGETCAVKILEKNFESRRDRFANECRILEVLQHPHIAAYLGDGTTGLGRDDLDIPWLATELGGGNLMAHVRNKGPLTPALLILTLGQLASALACFHAGERIHRDLKPNNLIWKSADPAQGIFMVDFGIAKYVGEDVSGRPLDDLTKSDEFVGPALWSSPEMVGYAFDKRTLVDQRSDLFQFGKVAWYLATGRVTGGVPSRGLDPTGGALCDLVTHLLQDDPDDRFQSATEVETALAGLPG